MFWEYDGSFGGLLTAVFRVFEAKDMDARIVPRPGATSWKAARNADLESHEGQLGFEWASGAAETAPSRSPTSQTRGTDPMHVEFKEDLAQRVRKGLERTAGTEAGRILRNAFLCSHPRPEDALLGYVRLCMRKGSAALRDEADPAIRQTIDRSRAVDCEAHKFMGLLRFQELDDGQGYYAWLKPDHHILPLLGEHFAQRMGDQDWIIHDRGRKLALRQKSGELDLLEDVQMEGDLPLSVAEQGFQGLWQEFFRAVAIPGRSNARLQMSKIPKKYWESLIELPGSSKQKQPNRGRQDYQKNGIQLEAPMGYEDSRKDCQAGP